MSGDWLALGAVSLLAAAGATRRGSRAVERQVVFQLDQIPLPVDWHGDEGSQTRNAYRPGWVGPTYRWGGWSRGTGSDGVFRLVQWRLTVDAEGRWSVAAFDPSGGQRPSRPIPYLHLEESSPTGDWQTGIAALLAAVGAVIADFNPPRVNIKTADEYDAQIQRTREQRRKQERRGTRISGQGYYPDLLGPPADLRGWCVDRDDIEVEHNSGRIRHYSCDSGYRHHIQVLDSGDVVAGISLYAKKPWRGLQTATIATVYVDQGHRRQGLASELLNYARGHFRAVRHSKDLTDAGVAWKRAVR